MSHSLARALMDEFAEATGVSGGRLPRRYLWTDAFAVCNFLGLARQTGDGRYLDLARELVDQVHHVLGRHREDDERRGWISGLPEKEGEQHPTCGGLRIGKPLNERARHEPTDSRLEWDRDGQYFHYLTKWMHALHRMGQETGEDQYHVWAVELAVAAQRAFTRDTPGCDSKRMVWKMSIDLTRPLVPSMGQHDPLDGLVGCLELRPAGGGEPETRSVLAVTIAELTEMCNDGMWATDDPLGIGGLLDNATRLGQLVLQHRMERRELLTQALDAADLSLRSFGPSFHRISGSLVEQRLAFRELGLSIGLHGLQRLRTLAEPDRGLVAVCDRLLAFEPLADEIESYWSDATHRRNQAWLEHREINSVMLATSLAPDGYFSR